MPEKLAEMIRKHRQRSGLTRVEFAKLAGVGKGTVYDLEHGKLTIQFNNVLKICHTLNIKIKFIEPHG